uniref:Uncharacterized protein n=1 Tax=Anguilla anguilla TaxID=7936 RepID=A0A0E9VY10_ANGAN
MCNAVMWPHHSVL